MTGLWLAGILVFGGLGLVLAILIALAVRESEVYGWWHPPSQGIGDYAWLLVDVAVAAFYLRGWERLYPFACLAFLGLAFFCYLNFTHAARMEREAAVPETTGVLTNPPNLHIVLNRAHPTKLLADYLAAITKDLS
jgi:hypothetical protein